MGVRAVRTLVPTEKTLLFLSTDADLWRMNPGGDERMRLTTEAGFVPVMRSRIGSDWSDDGGKSLHLCLFRTIQLSGDPRGDHPEGRLQ